MLERIHYNNRTDWLKGRECGLGASDIASVCGLSPWQTSTELWQIKTGRKQPEDFSTNEAVNLGVRCEDALRQLFMAKHSEYSLEYFPFDILRQKERPWQFATLDGELIRKSDKKRGILEIKTGTPTGVKWKEWEGKVPDNYYVQLMAQFNATDFDFAFLFAGLFTQDGNIICKEYEFYKDECKQDMEWVLDKATNFWKSVSEDKVPSLTISL